MKRQFLVVLGLLVAAGIGLAQQPMQPNCQYKYRFTNRTGETAETGVIITGGAAAAPWIDNTAQGCMGWQLQYSSEGFSGISLNLQSAPRTYAGAVGASTPGAPSTFSGTDVLSSLPLTSTSGSQYIGYGFYPYIRVNLATATGTGTVEVVLNGWKSISYAKGLGAGSGTTVAGDVTGTLGASVAVSSSNATGFDLKQNSLVIEIPNSGSPGTTLNKLVKIPAASASVLTTSAADQVSAIGIVVASAGTTGNAQIGVLGQFSCLFDNTATTAGDFIVPSSVTAATCSDAGAGYPASGEVMGQVLSTHAACGSPPCGPYTVLFGTPDITLPGASGPSGNNGNGNNGGAKQQLHAFACSIGSKTGTTVITTGDTGCYISSGASTGTINRVDVVGNAASLATCSITVDIWKANAALPTSGNKISASAPATLSTATLSQSGSLTGWTKAVAANDIWNANVASVTGCVGATVEVFFQ